MKTIEPAWREDAINWIHRQASDLPESPATSWHVAKPSLEARVNALNIIRFVSPSLVPPVELSVTQERGIELEWNVGTKELTIEILSDGSVEILKCESGKPVEEKTLPKPDWRLGSSFDWLES